jgi:hypothetical protein
MNRRAQPPVAHSRTTSWQTVRVYRSSYTKYFSDHETYTLKSTLTVTYTTNGHITAGILTPQVITYPYSQQVIYTTVTTTLGAAASTTQEAASTTDGAAASSNGGGAAATTSSSSAATPSGGDATATSDSSQAGLTTITVHDTAAATTNPDALGIDPTRSFEGSWATSSLDASDKPRLSKGAITGMAVGIALFVILAAVATTAAIVYARHRRSKKTAATNTGVPPAYQDDTKSEEKPSHLSELPNTNRPASELHSDTSPRLTVELRNSHGISELASPLSPPLQTESHHVFEMDDTSVSALQSPRRGPVQEASHSTDGAGPVVLQDFLSHQPSSPSVSAVAHSDREAVITPRSMTSGGEPSPLHDNVFLSLNTNAGPPVKTEQEGIAVSGTNIDKSCVRDLASSNSDGSGTLTSSSAPTQRLPYPLD